MRVRVHSTKSLFEERHFLTLLVSALAVCTSAGQPVSDRAAGAKSS